MREHDPALLKGVERYYTERVTLHGATARGVDWNSAESQRLRFEQVAHLWENDGEREEIGLIDYGCGYGALLDFLDERGLAFRYQGYDISEAMIREARERSGARGTFTTDARQLTRADYVVASGIFNVKLDAAVDAWEEHVAGTIEDMIGLADRGIASNVLTSYSDPERRRPDLYYADPLHWFEHCMRRRSRFVTLLHDYPLYEFTLIVRLDSR